VATSNVPGLDRGIGRISRPVTSTRSPRCGTGRLHGQSRPHVVGDGRKEDVGRRPAGMGRPDDHALDGRDAAALGHQAGHVVGRRIHARPVPRRPCRQHHEQERREEGLRPGTSPGEHGPRGRRNNGNQAPDHHRPADVLAGQDARHQGRGGWHERLVLPDGVRPGHPVCGCWCHGAAPFRLRCGIPCRAAGPLPAGKSSHPPRSSSRKRGGCGEPPRKTYLTPLRTGREGSSSGPASETARARGAVRRRPVPCRPPRRSSPGRPCR